MTQGLWPHPHAAPHCSDATWSRKLGALLFLEVQVEALLFLTLTRGRVPALCLAWTIFGVLMSRLSTDPEKNLTSDKAKEGGEAAGGNGVGGTRRGGQCSQI
jgi:hypothetical protein